MLNYFRFNADHLENRQRLVERLHGREAGRGTVKILDIGRNMANVCDFVQREKCVRINYFRFAIAILGNSGNHFVRLKDSYNMSQNKKNDETENCYRAF